MGMRDVHVIRRHREDLQSVILEYPAQLTLRTRTRVDEYLGPGQVQGCDSRDDVDHIMVPENPRARGYGIFHG
jgi:hypothetical protein